MSAFLLGSVCLWCVGVGVLHFVSWLRCWISMLCLWYVRCLDVAGVYVTELGCVHGGVVVVYSVYFIFGGALLSVEGVDELYCCVLFS